MSDFSLELTAERITDSRTKKYFSEVLSCYNSGCYRSSVVMLWSIVICDVLFKMIELRDLYGDLGATSIINEIEKIRGGNKKSPDWEWKLIQLVKEKTLLLEDGDFANLEALQSHRHLSAHPVLTASEVLFEPNRETARAHIRNALEGVLTKPSIMTKKIFDSLIEDLEKNSANFINISILERYLKSKYLPHLVPMVQKSIFRSFWKVVFRSTDKRCTDNRLINLGALSVIYSKNKDFFKSVISEEVDYYSEIAGAGSEFEYFQVFIGTHPELFSLLSDKARVHLEAAAAKSLDDFALSWFLTPSLEEHLTIIKSRLVKDKKHLSKKTFERLFEAGLEAGKESLVLDVAIVQFGLSQNFDMADKYFIALIGPNIMKFDKTQLLDLAASIESNNQIYVRGKAQSHHSLILPAIHHHFGDRFEFTKYPNFAETVGASTEVTAAEDDIPF